MLRLLWISLLGLLTCCGYRWTSEQNPVTVFVPFVIGDEDGSLTQEIMWALSRSGLVRIEGRQAEVRIEVQIVESKNDTIGFRRDPQLVKGKVSKNLLASEARKTMTLEVCIFRQGEQSPFLGPIRISADADYDYVDGDSFEDLAFTDSSGKIVTVLPFSLGQLESIESAQEAATRPIYRKLGQKLADFLVGSL